MTIQKKTYHHGNLISSLIKAASDILQEEGVEDLSMRKLADKVGVSRTAPYHHFKDKNKLLCAIAEAGFKTQEARLQSLLSSHEASEKRFHRYVVGRKNWLFANTGKGAKSSAILYSIIETAKANGLIPYDYLTTLFETLPLLNDESDHDKIDRLLPWNIKKGK